MIIRCEQKFAPGARVLSKPVEGKGSFLGVVVERSGDEYVIKDFVTGEKFNRHLMELAPK